MYLYATCVYGGGCPRRPEEVTRVPGAGVMGGCEPPVLMWVLGKEPGSPARVAGALNLEPSTTPDCCLSDLQTGNHTGCALWGLASFTYHWIVAVIQIVCVFNGESIL